MEAAFIRDEPLFRGARTQTELAPFRAQLLHCAVFPKDCKYSFDSVSFKDTFNLTLGFDAWDFRPLKSFGRMHVTPAIYYKHIFDIDPLQAFPIPHADNRNLVIPQVANQILNLSLIHISSPRD